jgi:hypothetical protein
MLPGDCSYLVPTRLEGQASLWPSGGVSAEELGPPRPQWSWPLSNYQTHCLLLQLPNQPQGGARKGGLRGRGCSPKGLESCIPAIVQALRADSPRATEVSAGKYRRCK